MIDTFSFLNTTSDRDVFVKAIDFLLSGLYSTKATTVSELSKNGLPEEMALYLEKITSDTKDKHPNEARGVLLKLKDAVLKIPILKATIAFKSTSSFNQYLSSFFTMSLEKKVLLEVFVDENMTGGIKFETKGQYRDFSLPKVIDQLFSEHREEIGGMVG